jgi:tellurite resistance protein
MDSEFTLTASDYHVVVLLARLGWLLALGQAYFVFSSLWPRKHDPEVVNSQGLIGNALTVVLGLMLLFSAFFAHSWSVSFLGILVAAGGVLRAGIAVGRWTLAAREQPLAELIGARLQRDKEAAAGFVQSLFRPAAAEQLIEILGNVALVDGKIDEGEKRVVDEFAKKWRVPLDWPTLQVQAARDTNQRLSAMRHAVGNYIESLPPLEQARQLFDVVMKVTEADGVLSAEERTLRTEVSGIMGRYLGGKGASENFFVAIVPRNSDQDQAIPNIIRNAKRKELGGGVGYIIGPYHSLRFAAIIAREHCALNLAAVVLDERMRQVQTDA